MAHPPKLSIGTEVVPSGVKRPCDVDNCSDLCDLKARTEDQPFGSGSNQCIVTAYCEMYVRGHIQ